MSKSLTSLTSLTQPAPHALDERVGCPDLIGQRQCALCVYNLSPTRHPPKSILSSRVVDGNVPALLHPVRNRAAIFAIVEPLAEVAVAACGPLDAAERHGSRIADPIKHVGKLSVFRRPI
jgi:hypothetical protein